MVCRAENKKRSCARARRCARPIEESDGVLAERVGRVVAAWVAEEAWEDAPPLVMERPADSEHGDYATPYCMQLAKVAHRAPRALAEELIGRLQADPSVSELVESFEIAGPGFLNLRPPARGVPHAPRGLCSPPATTWAVACASVPCTSCSSM